RQWGTRGRHRTFHRPTGRHHTVGKNRDTSVRLLAMAFGADAWLLFERDMHDPPLIRLHRVHEDALAGPPNPVRETERHFFYGFLPAVAVVLDVHNQPAAIRAAFIQDQVDDGLKCPQRLTAPADQEPE